VFRAIPEPGAPQAEHGPRSAILHLHGVVIPLLLAHAPMLGRTLLYTAPSLGLT
jgi:hypothetical protein